MPPHKVMPLAITSMRRSSGRVKCSMLKHLSILIFGCCPTALFFSFHFCLHSCRCAISSAFTPGNHFQHILPVDAHSKLGTLNWKCFAGTKLFGQLGNCCEKCGPMGCSASMLPGFLFHVNVATTFSERRL